MNPEDYECEVTAPRVYVRAGRDVQPAVLVIGGTIHRFLEENKNHILGTLILILVTSLGFAGA